VILGMPTVLTHAERLRVSTQISASTLTKRVFLRDYL
jgi:hypothetical protein